jgi:hypothetical protein
MEVSVEGLNIAQLLIYLIKRCWGSFPGVKQPERDVDHSPPPSTEVKMRGAIPLLLVYAFMVWRGTTFH